MLSQIGPRGFQEDIPGKRDTYSTYKFSVLGGNQDQLLPIKLFNTKLIAVF
jgi:hypothetical protein